MENTTNINELPLESTPPENRNLPEGQLNSSVNHMIDPNSRQNEDKYVQIQEPRYQPNLNKQFEVKDTHKVIILATIFFLLFSDIKVKSYILNILITILGGSLKTASGSISKIGLIMYTVVYASTLFTMVNLIDIAVLRFA